MKRVDPIAFAREALSGAGAPRSEREEQRHQRQRAIDDAERRERRQERENLETDLADLGLHLQDWACESAHAHAETNIEADARDETGRFARGYSGNVGGRPRRSPEEKAAERRAMRYASGRSVWALKELEGIAGDLSVDAKVRVSALNSILDRGIGRPRESVEATNTVRLGPDFATLISFEDGGPGSAARTDEPPIDDERDAEPEQQPPLALPAPASQSGDLDATASSPAPEPIGAQAPAESAAQTFARLGSEQVGEYLPAPRRLLRRSPPTEVVTDHLFAASWQRLLKGERR
ncbi:MAG TPA: hypothetical protein VIY54_05400 [Steroidobacteraceae bacterium]